ncbi:tRNA (adenosine(37)-N6)-dimethylallyltransferase MiaA [Novosphingobium profundi]|uniref:tRNA (adenosine(37)-N6)-dimethylallyltransferase MiaA n=1 Tax=Novosphingobium profundi TaxID=1774954 RepID=UPI001BDADAE0|nr:tRNA (adenosine(37)-N6)-dimethylallyltransferase MiaA [Novosphingobium profundi]MBT0669078.1 tRNA (adenosine(37)-N6)-dimethylallyltransferase MiaA [Novosphingobium profundi]
MSTAKFLDAIGDSFGTGADVRPPLALIAGPTASGKSDCAVALARELQDRGRSAVIVNADASQVYADIPILSACPSEDERGGIDHRLFGTWDAAESCSAADWANAAAREIAAIHAQGAVPILVGGTGLYIRTLLDGIAPIPPIDPEIREAVRALPVAEAHAALTREDPERAMRLAPADTTRVARALEVVRSTGRPLAHWQARKEGGIGETVTLFPAILMPERQWLYDRCDLRFARMIEAGALEEVRKLLARDLSPDLPAMRAIGVPELAEHLRGAIALDEAMARGAQATRRYAKRQFTWLRHQPPGDWLRIEVENYTLKSICDILFRRFGLT